MLLFGMLLMSESVREVDNFFSFAKNERGVGKGGTNFTLNTKVSE